MALFTDLRQRVASYVTAFGLPIYDAEEIVQEVFLALFRHLQLEKSRENLRGWIFRVAHNLALKRRHANRRTSQMDVDSQAESRARVDPQMNPEERVLSAQRRERLLSVVNALPEEDRCCLRLRAEGLRYREISQVLGMSLGSVSISLTRSLARLARASGE